MHGFEIASLPAGALAHHIFTSTTPFDQDDRLRWQFTILDQLWPAPWEADQHFRRRVSVAIPDTSLDDLPVRRIISYLSEFAYARNIRIWLTWKEDDGTYPSSHGVAMHNPRFDRKEPDSKEPELAGLLFELITKEALAGTGDLPNRLQCGLMTFGMYSLPEVTNATTVADILTAGVETLSGDSSTHFVLHEDNKQPRYFRKKH
jgi:hypothetical protein